MAVADRIRRDVWEEASRELSSEPQGVCPVSTRGRASEVGTDRAKALRQVRVWWEPEGGLVAAWDGEVGAGWPLGPHRQGEGLF